MTGMDLIRAKRGLLAKLARDLGLTRAAVAMWQQVPAERLSDVQQSTGIPAELLRPDIAGLFVAGATNDAARDHQHG